MQLQRCALFENWRMRGGTQVEVHTSIAVAFCTPVLYLFYSYRENVQCQAPRAKAPFLFGPRCLSYTIRLKYHSAKLLHSSRVDISSARMLSLDVTFECFNIAWNHPQHRSQVYNIREALADSSVLHLVGLPTISHIPHLPTSSLSIPRIPISSHRFSAVS